MKDVAVVAYCRTAIAEAQRGALNHTHGIPLAAHVLRKAVERAGIEGGEIEEVILGCGLREGATGHNIARNAAFEAFSVPVPGATINRYRGSGITAASRTSASSSSASTSKASSTSLPSRGCRRCGGR